MRLPPHILSQVKWFEHYRESGAPNGGSETFGDRFVLHFKRWWKPRKTVWFSGAYVTTTDGANLYRQSPEAAELLAQLKVYCNQ